MGSVALSLSSSNESSRLVFQDKYVISLSSYHVAPAPTGVESENTARARRSDALCALTFVFGMYERSRLDNEKATGAL